MKLESISEKSSREIREGHSVGPDGTILIPSASGRYGAQDGTGSYPAPTAIRISVGDPPTEMVADVSRLDPALVQHVRQTLAPHRAIEELQRLQKAAMDTPPPVFPAEAVTQEQVLASAPIAPAAPAAPAAVKQPTVEIGFRVKGLGVIPSTWSIAQVDKTGNLLLLGRAPGVSGGLEPEPSGEPADVIVGNQDVRIVLSPFVFPVPVGGIYLLAYPTVEAQDG